MQKKHSVSMLLLNGDLAVDFDIFKTASHLATQIAVSQRLPNSDLYMRGASDFIKVGLTTEVSRFSAKSLKVHTDWIEDNKKAIEAEVLEFYKKKLVA